MRRRGVAIGFVGVIAPMAKVFVITGPSGVGKGTLISKLLDRVPELELSVSATTRARRDGEVDGRDYHFLDPAEFDRLVEEGAFLEHATYSGNRYGTLRSEVQERLQNEKSVVLEIELQGARQVRDAMPEAVRVFVKPPHPDDLRRRLEERGTDDASAIDRRLRTAAEELAAEDEFSYVVTNDDIEAAVGELERIVRGELAAE
jgi:guanylate kinase